MLDKKNITVRRASLSDSEVIYKWVNNKDSLINKLNTKKEIEISDHDTWFRNILNDKNSYIWIILLKNIEIGQIRMEYKKDLFHEVDIYLEKDYRKKGIAKISFEVIQGKIKLNNLRAIIKKYNKNSFAFFESIGFDLISQNNKIWIFEKKYF